MGPRFARSSPAAMLRASIVCGSLALLALLAVDGALAAGSPAPSGSDVAPSLPTATGSAAPTEGPTAAASSLAPASLPPLPASAETSCFTCHRAVDPDQRTIAEKWQQSVHGQAGITCADCHGGDPTSDEVGVAMSTTKGFRGVPGRTETVALCGTCHSDVDRMRQYQIPTDQYAKYKASVHGERLLTQRDSRVAICTDCHGVHDVKKASDPTAAVYPPNVPQLCASCHADPDKMAPYDIPTDQFAIYQQSVHGKALLGNKDLRAPTCASCHGSHDAKPPTSVEVVGVCGKCHTATQALYEKSRHSQLDVGPKCWTCHGTHDVVKPDETRFFHPKPPQIDCTTCHDPTDRSLILQADRFEDDADRRCDTCHHTNSILYAQAEGIHDALTRASTAYQLAQGKVDEAAGVGMIVSDADVQLTEAKTALIRARAAVHTTRLTDVSTLADDAQAKADEARAFADARLGESLFRRQAMVVILAIILINVFTLILVRRRIDHSYREG